MPNPKDGDGFVLQKSLSGESNNALDTSEDASTQPDSEDRIDDDVQTYAPASVDKYIELCRKYGTEPNSGVLVALRFSLHALRPTAKFFCKDVLPLADLVLALPQQTAHIKSVDLSHARLRSHGAVVLSAILPARKWEKLELKHNPIGGHGARALLQALEANSHLQYLGLRGCSIGVAGAEALAALIAGQGAAQLAAVDVSVNHMGLHGAVLIKTAAISRKATLKVDMENNIVLAEVLSSVTHGIGLLLAIFSSYFMETRAAQMSSTHVWATSVYTASLITLYFASTLFHSSFMLSTTKDVLAILDRCAIFVLIAGTYTPVLAITMHDDVRWSIYMLVALWVIAIMGFAVTALYTGKWKGRISLSFYLIMGWAALICLGDIARVMPADGIFWLVGGGVLYTAGVPFFALDQDPTTSMFHVVWHLFVMGGSAAHWWMVYEHVLPFPLPIRPQCAAA
mmetsp:Transcript_40535/g.95204  ORF Transcript_40535/g.95204 Transcript_40535/m.95204 type:complete len:455 (+) Transcript_40535:164-1528(+)